MMHRRHQLQSLRQAISREDIEVAKPSSKQIKRN